VEALAILGYGGGPRLKNAAAFVLSKQDDSGRWPLEYSLQGKTWIDWGQTGEASKWVTLRVVRALKKIEGIPD
jgi:hypothetical protein